MTSDVESGQNWLDPEGDINWIGIEWEKRARTKSLDWKGFEVTLRQVLLKLLKKANKLNDNLSRFFFTAGDRRSKIEVCDNQWKKMLTRRTPGNYVFRLFFNQTNFSKVKSFEVLHSRTRAANKDRALLKLHHALILEERQRLRSLLKPCIDETSGHVLPEKICSWLIPALKKASHKMRNIKVQGYQVTVSTDHTKEGLFLTFTSSSSDGHEARTVTTEVELAVVAYALPKSFKIPNPYHMNSPDHKKGSRLVSQIRKAFAQEKIFYVLYSPMSNIVNMPQVEKTKIPRLERMIQKVIDDFNEFDKGWRMDVEAIELALYKSIRYEPNVKLCLHALRLYNALTCIDKDTMPRLNRRTKVSVVLWILKKHGHRRMGKRTMLLKVLGLLDTCIQNGFFPSFVRPTVTTMAVTKTSDENNLVDTDEDYDSIDNENDEEINTQGTQAGTSLASTSTYSSETTDFMSSLQTEMLQGKSILSVIIDLVKNKQNTLLINLFKLSCDDINS